MGAPRAAALRSSSLNKKGALKKLWHRAHQWKIETDKKRKIQAKGNVSSASGNKFEANSGEEA
jgi:hypothetical protein